jgi:hypothetical protein
MEVDVALRRFNILTMAGGVYPRAALRADPGEPAIQRSLAK